ncbi:MAG: tetratricopeptide repeat protein [Acidobacteriota bacterium]|nr:tetratricopeptide repeat protein [Acidobacteriota bacterium]
MKQRKWMILTLAVIAVGLLAFPMEAQRLGHGKARLNGDVVNQEGNPVANAQVELMFEDNVTKFTATTDEKGEWAVIGLGSGQFRITVSAEGYIPAQKLVQVSQLNRNPKVQHQLQKAVQPVMHEDLLGFLEEGNAQFKEGNYDQAIESYQKILDKHPDMVAVLFKIGDCHREKRDLDKAVEVYTKVAELAAAQKDNNVHAQALGNLGAISIQREDFDQANQYFQQAIDLNPEDEILAYNVAEINFNSNNVDLAIKYYQMAAEAKPDWSLPHQKLGYSYLNKGDFAAARASFEKFLELESEGEQAAIIRDLLNSLPQS